MAAVEAIAPRAAGVETRRRFQRYLDLFLHWNRTHRMTTLDSPLAVVRKLFADSLLFLPLLPSRRPLVVVDIGAGAGIPGLPLRLADPQIRLTLIESRRKRVSFLRAARRELGLDDVSVEEGRAEHLVEERASLHEAFDAAVARAVSPADTLREVALKYLKTGGVFIASAGPKSTPRDGAQVVHVPIPWGRTMRSFRKITKES